jgi:hypothetical protein
MTIVEVLTRIDSIVTASPFDYRAAKEPFGFDLEANQLLDHTYCVKADEPREIGGYIGYGQSEIVPVTIRLARKVQRDAVAAYRAMLTDVSSLQSALTRDGVLGDYNADVERWRVLEPGPKDDFVIGEIVAITDYEHQL